jgi:adenine deaminase
MISIRGKVVDVDSGEIRQEELFIQDGRFIDPGKGSPEIKFDFSGKYIVPGFIDSHVHIESSMLTPSNFARAVLPHGTAAVVTDPHEIANVAGLDGVRFMISDSEASPLGVYFTAPSCVPATHMETSGAVIGVDEIRQLLRHERCVALGEMMNFPGVVAGIPEVMEKIRAAREAGKPVDGHAPGLSGERLRKYIQAGISTDHECRSAGEARDKLDLGMKIMIRAGSSMHNLKELAEIVGKDTIGSLFLVSDDIHAGTILEQGHIDRILREAVDLGVDPVHALRMVTSNPASHYNLEGLGSLRPGSRATFAVLEDLKDFRVQAFFVDGEKIAENGRLLRDLQEKPIPESILSSVNSAPITEDSLRVPSGNPAQVNVIRVPNEWEQAGLESDGKFLIPSTDQDVLPVVVVERHKSTGNIGQGFVKGFGLRQGALASTVAHDSHNMVCTADNYPDMLFALESLRKSGGGIAVVSRGEVLGLLELPVAGLMSTEPAESVRSKLEELHQKVSDLGCELKSPFMELAFLALPVIPKLKLTDKGLVDVNSFRLIDVKAGAQ